MEENPDRTVYAADDEINLLDYVKVVWKHKKLIIRIVIVVVIATAIASLLMTKVYEAKAVIIPSGVKDSGMSSLLAGQFGLAPPTSPISSEIVNILKGNTLKEKIIINNNLLPILLQNTAQRDNKTMWAGINALKGMTKINFIAKENIIELSIRYKDPKMAADLVNMTLNELTEYMSGEIKRVAETNRKYLESQVDKMPDPFIKSKIYSLIAQQIETAMMAEVKENFAFKILDPPRVPDQAIAPKKRQMVMISFVVSLFLGIFVAFGNEYVEKTTKKSIAAHCGDCIEKLKHSKFVPYFKSIWRRLKK